MYTKNINYRASPIMIEVFTNRNELRQHSKSTTETPHTLKYNTRNTLYITTKSTKVSNSTIGILKYLLRKKNNIC